MTTNPLDAGYSSFQDGRLSIPPEEPEETPADFYDHCIHHCACRMWWERFNGVFADGCEGWKEDLAAGLGCGECDEYED